jgi:adhesin transport system membrane fusion protein
MEKEDIEFMSDLQAAENLQPNKAAQIFLWVIAGFFLWVFIWAAFSKVEERVRGTGHVMPSGDIQVVQSLEGGILTKILVTEGAAVKKGQILLRIDDRRFASEGRGIEAQMIGLKAKQARLKAEAAGSDFVIDPEIEKKYPDIAANEKKLYTSRQQEMATAVSIIESEVREAEANLSEIKASIGKYARSRDLLQKELGIMRRLVEKKAQPEIEQLRLERELNEASGNLSTAVQSQQSLEARLSTARKREQEKRSALRSQVLGELNDVETKLAAISQNLNVAEDRISRTELRAPVDGIVHKLHVKTEGGVIEPAQKLAEIVPSDNDLMVRAQVSPADIAFLKTGQSVRVSVTAYDPQIYGTLDGTLERVSADTVEDGRGNVFFEIDVRTKKNHLGPDTQPLPIVPGMISETDVIVGKRTILTYLMKPVLRAKDRALTEK